jgi:hypothetical protein
MAVVLISPCQLVMHILHELCHAVLSLAQLRLDLVQVCSYVVCGVLLYREQDLVYVNWDWDGLDESCEVTVRCVCW